MGFPEAEAKSLYKTVVAEGQRSLSPELRARISAPEVYYAEPHYFGAKRRIAVLGQVAANDPPPFPEGDGGTEFDELLCKKVALYGEMERKRPPGAYWTGMQRLAERFGLPDVRSLAWLNLFVVEPFPRFKKGEKIDPIFQAPDIPENINHLLAWQGEYLCQSLRLLEPDLIFAYSGSYLWAFDRLGQGLEAVDIDSHPSKSLYEIKGFYAKCVATYHPSYYNRRPIEAALSFDAACAISLRHLEGPEATP